MARVPSALLLWIGPRGRCCRLSQRPTSIAHKLTQHWSAVQVVTVATFFTYASSLTSSLATPDAGVFAALPLFSLSSRSLLDFSSMELARALTTRRRDAAASRPTPSRMVSINKAHAAGSIDRAAISRPLELLSTTNVLAYNAPNIYASSDESEASFTMTASSRATTPDLDSASCSTAATSSPIEPANMLHGHFQSIRRPSQSSHSHKESLDSVIPPLPQRLHQRPKTPQVPPIPTQSLVQPLKMPSAPSPVTSPMDRNMFSNLPDAEHPFGAELAQVNELAEGFSARDVIIMDEEEQFLLDHGLYKYGVHEYVDEIQGLFGSAQTNPWTMSSRWF